MADNTYIVHNNEKELQLEIVLEGEKAYLSYRFYKKDIALMHTFVPPHLEGKGIASELAKAAFRYAEELKRPVMVYCPYVAAFVKRHPEYQKQLDPQYYRS